MEKLLLMRLLAFLLLLVPIVSHAQDTARTQNIILVTWDGYRWQELFKGAQKKLIRSKKLSKDPEALQNQFWAKDAEARRKQLTPFIWNTIGTQGAIIGNKSAGCSMQVTNPYRFSYPGYNEIFSGYGDKRVNSNDYPDNPNNTIFDYLQGTDKFKNKMAAFATWDAFPRIINSKRNGVPVYVNYETKNGITACNGTEFNVWQTSVPACSPFCQTDTMTYHFAKEYMQKNHPRFTFIGFDETDHFGHEGEYDAYLGAAHTLDAYLQDLWTFVQNDPQYKDNTTLIVTCDHGRGVTGTTFWRHHGVIILPAKQVWLAAIGPGIKAIGTVKKGKFYQKQIAATLAKLLGYKFNTEAKIGAPIDAILK